MMEEHILPLPSYPSGIIQVSIPMPSSTPKSSQMSRLFPSRTTLLRKEADPVVSKSMFIPVSNLPTKTETFVTVLEDIDPALEEHDHTRPLLTLKAGDIIHVLQRWKGDRWFGQKTSDNTTGFFILDERIRPNIGRKARALLDWNDETKHGLLLNKDREIEVMHPHSAWWFWGRTKRAVGLVPFNFVEPIPDDMSSLKSSNLPENTSRKALNEYPAGSQVRCIWPKEFTDPRLLRLKMNEVIEVLMPDMTYAWGLGQTKDGKKGLFATKLVSSVLEPVRPPWSPYYARAIVSSRSRSFAEPELSKDEIIEVLDMRADRYWLGRLRNGREGLFYSKWLRPVLNDRSFELEDALPD